jgi:hypothetical protein
MEWVVGVVVGLGLCVLLAVWFARASSSGTSASPAAPLGASARSPHADGAAVTDLLRQAEACAAATMPEVEAKAAAMMPEVEAEAERLHAEMLRDLEQDDEFVQAVPESPKPDDAPVGLGLSGGPPWMPRHEWADKVAVYRGQGRSEADIREVAEYLTRRGPRWPMTPAERADRAERLGLVSREEYLSPEAETEALTTGPDGLPDVWLERVRDRLLVVTPHGWVNPKSRTAASRAGLWSFVVRGTAHHERAVRRGDFSPGAPVRLVREPDNQHDPNAIAIYAAGARDVAGYVPRGYAKRLAKLLDAGAEMVAVSTRGAGAGRQGVSPQVLVVERVLWEHLNRAMK